MDDSSKRILHVFARMDRGGAETRTMEVYRKINREDIQFDFINLEDGEHHYDEEIRDLGGRKFIVRHPRKAGIIKHLLDMYKIMKSKGPFQAVHAHTAHHAGMVALVAKFAGIKYIVCHARTTSTKDRGSLAKRLSIFLGRYLILLNATSMLAISKAAGEYIFGKRTMEKKKASVIPNAIDLIPYKGVQEIDTKMLRSDFGISNCQLLIGHVGRFNHMKNHKFLIQLLNSVRESGIDAHLVLVGGGELRSDIEKTVENNELNEFVHFLGVRNDIPRLMGMFDVFVMPSIYEGLGGAAIEAQAAGTPCILSSSLPREVDMDIGIIQFLSLDCAVEIWRDSVINQSNLDRPNYQEIMNSFRRKGFLIEEELKSLFIAYGIENN